MQRQNLEEFFTPYEFIRDAFKMIVVKTKEALTCEENDRVAEAVPLYTQSIELINDIFNIRILLPKNFENIEGEWIHLCIMIQKLKDMKAQAIYRLDVLSGRDLDSDKNEGPEASRKERVPERELPQSCQNLCRESGSLCAYRLIVQGLRHIISVKETEVTFHTLFNATATIYKIQTNGTVSAVVGENPISLVQCSTGGKWKHLNGVLFIQCVLFSTPGEQDSENMVWIYPLLPLVVYFSRNEEGGFVFPDMESTEPGSIFIITILDATVEAMEYADCDPHPQQTFLQLIEGILGSDIENLSDLDASRQKRDASDEISKRMVTTGDFIARNLIKGAKKTDELMVRATPHIMSRIEPATVAPTISPGIQTTVAIAKGATGLATGVTSWVVGKVGTISMALGHYLAPHIQTQGANLLEKCLGYDNREANQKMESALTIAAGALEAASNVYNGLETSAKILGNSISANSVEIIRHKYGAPAANVAAGTFDTLGNAFQVSQNVNYITPKGLAKKMAKSTGKAAFREFKSYRNENFHYVPAGFLYADFSA